MENLQGYLENEKRELEEIAKEAKKRLQNAPKGYLRIANKPRGIEYYYKKEKEDRDKNYKKNGIYIKKSQIELVKKLAQKDFDICLVAKAHERIKAINDFLNIYEKTDIKNMYERINNYRKGLIYSPIVSDSEYVKQWQDVEYKGKGFIDGVVEIYTEKGERVRSKSEKIIADKLYMLGIPYRYECPLILDGNIKIYPDFTILKVETREEIYLEHFEKMDDKDYVDTFIYKLDTYERNGIYPGVNLFFTHETAKRPLNVKSLDKFIKKLLCGR